MGRASIGADQIGNQPLCDQTQNLNQDFFIPNFFKPTINFFGDRIRYYKKFKSFETDTKFYKTMFQPDKSKSWIGLYG